MKSARYYQMLNLPLKSSNQYPGRSFHHLVARNRGGRDGANKALLKLERHSMIHKLMGDKTPEEMIALIQRFIRFKKHQAPKYQQPKRRKAA